MPLSPLGLDLGVRWIAIGRLAGLIRPPMKNLMVGLIFMLAGFAAGLRAEGLNPDAQKKVDAVIHEAETWAAAPEIHDAVMAQNKATPADIAGMTEEKWKTLTDMDPFVHSLAVNYAAKYLRQKKSAAVSEAFLSDAQGLKVAFLSKTTSWSHHGKPKHEQPMSGKTWQGKLEIDQSSGMQQLQIAVPVFNADKPIGSLVVGISITAFISQ